MTNHTEEVIPLSPPSKNNDDNNYSSTSNSLRLNTPRLLRLRSPLGKSNRVISRGDIDDDDTKSAAAREQTIKCTFSKKRLIGIVSSFVVILIVIIVAVVATSNNGSSSKQSAINNAVSVSSNAAIEDASTPADSKPATIDDTVAPTIATVDTQDTINTTGTNNSSLTVADIAGAIEEKESEYASSSSGFGFNLLPSSSSWGNSHKPKSGKESKAVTETTSAKSAKDSKATSGKASKKDRDGGDRDGPDDPTPPPPPPPTPTPDPPTPDPPTPDPPTPDPPTPDPPTPDPPTPDPPTPDPPTPDPPTPDPPTPDPPTPDPPTPDPPTPDPPTPDPPTPDPPATTTPATNPPPPASTTKATDPPPPTTSSTALTTSTSKATPVTTTPATNPPPDPTTTVAPPPVTTTVPPPPTTTAAPPDTTTTTCVGENGNCGVSTGVCPGLDCTTSACNGCCCDNLTCQLQEIVGPDISYICRPPDTTTTEAPPESTTTVLPPPDTTTVAPPTTTTTGGDTPFSCPTEIDDESVPPGGNCCEQADCIQGIELPATCQRSYCFTGSIPFDCSESNFAPIDNPNTGLPDCPACPTGGCAIVPDSSGCTAATAGEWTGICTTETGAPTGSPTKEPTPSGDTPFSCPTLIPDSSVPAGGNCCEDNDCVGGVLCGQGYCIDTTVSGEINCSASNKCTSNTDCSGDNSNCAGVFTQDSCTSNEEEYAGKCATCVASGGSCFNAFDSCCPGFECIIGAISGGVLCQPRER